ncbi:aminodeoxychorismate/anthranilate synthase component II [Ralstonia solanacearum]|uniref:Aminodeoxychorismate/anthranilate synthase component II n=1 Tax=Ralstonia solanacearum TaxID=305 RepID=A0AAW5ZPC5_RALSL|nr:aminodeoxychorismate/anthranilate synthase component II [Ralstonia solanacearum]AST33317.2 aminodeoxychorismate/anthranilate synthase component II [Ralstonia solanacearum]ATJ85300.1 glutamine amidotransferase [Ralstonia solanacearum]AYB50545.1 aminodeoxychorismate/anthranilate synthase component II [Ralstonia solanacearum]AYB55099.1 aminodeoxychorismate/anthranilate synthase component II [Ralstonia solanacearum]MBB6590227.1 aminodeoxychorismate/anthranilate synthase component II [Ralstonia 
MLLMIDNYDSFTYNIVQYFGELGQDVRTYRNDEITIEDIERLNPERICLSPGPCTPKEAGILVPALKHFAGRIPILGVCLGHQAIGDAFGGRVIRAQKVMHGKVSTIENTGVGVFANLPRHFKVTRYHSLAIERETLPDCLEVTAWTDDGEIMGVRHKTLPVEGVQFHPESILSEHGHALLANFLKERA